MRCRKKSKWFLIWKKNVETKKFKPLETKRIKIEEVNIHEIINREYDKDIINGFHSFVTKWKAQAVCDNSIVEKEIILEIEL